MHLSHTVYIHIINVNQSSMNNLYSGPTTLAPEYQSLLHINHIKSCPSYWHHIFIYLTSRFSYHLYSETSHRPFHISSILISTIYKHVHSVQEPWPNCAHYEVTLQSQRRIIRRSLRQSEGFLLARMSDVTHHPMSHITSAHNIPTNNIILRRNIKSPPI